MYGRTAESTPRIAAAVEVAAGENGESARRSSSTTHAGSAPRQRTSSPCTKSFSTRIVSRAPSRVHPRRMRLRRAYARSSQSCPKGPPSRSYMPPPPPPSPRLDDGSPCSQPHCDKCCNLRFSLRYFPTLRLYVPSTDAVPHLLRPTVSRPHLRHPPSR